MLSDGDDDDEDDDQEYHNIPSMNSECPSE